MNHNSLVGVALQTGGVHCAEEAAYCAQASGDCSTVL